MNVAKLNQAAPAMYAALKAYLEWVRTHGGHCSAAEVPSQIDHMMKAAVKLDGHEPLRISVVAQVSGGVLLSAHATEPPGVVVSLEVVDWDNIEAGDAGPTGPNYDETAHAEYVKNMKAIY